jgi:hypothetical protein
MNHEQKHLHQISAEFSPEQKAKDLKDLLQREEAC